MLQKCLSESSCTWTHSVMEEHYTRCQLSTLFDLNGCTQFFFFLTFHSMIVVPSCMNSTISTPFLSQKIFTISFLAGSICLTFLGLYGEYICIHCFECSLGKLSQVKHVSSPVTFMMQLANSSPSSCYCFTMSKLKLFSLYMSQYELHCCQVKI
jgi:hypothetical protein